MESGAGEDAEMGKQPGRKDKRGRKKRKREGDNSLRKLSMLKGVCAVCLIALWTAGGGKTVCGAAHGTAGGAEEVSLAGGQTDALSGTDSPEELEEELMDSMDLEQVQRAVDELLEGDGISVEDAVEGLLEGEEPFSRDAMEQVILSIVNSSWGTQKTIWLNILILVLAAALLSNFASLLPGGHLEEMSFYIVYLLVFALLVKNFGILSGEVQSTLGGIVAFMQALTPAYFLAVATASGATSAAMFYQIVLLVIFGVEKILISFILPGVHVYVLLSFVNQLSREDLLSKMAELLKTVICWIINTLTGILVGLQVIRSLIAPAIDSLKRSALGKTAEAIPGIGNAIGAVTEMVVGSAVLVKNCIGAVAMIVLVLCALKPVLNIALSGLAYRFLAAFTQPVSDKRMVGALHSMGEGCTLLLKVLFTTEILFLLTIAILAGTAG